MGPAADEASEGVTRRAVLRGVATAAAALTGGCVQRARKLLDRQTGTQVSLTIKTVPADEDRAATEIARTLRANLAAVGVDADIVLMREEELYRDVLINHKFDIYVARYPDTDDPDALRPLFHSEFGEEPGWQNPFGFTELTVDELLAEQRRQEGSDRRSTVFALQRNVARQQPLAVVGHPDEIQAVRTARFEGVARHFLRDPVDYMRVSVGRADDSSRDAGDEPSRRLRVTITDDRVTKNFNPIAVEFRNRGTFTGLLYDPLARRYDGAVYPWLARDWSWKVDGDETAAMVTLREDLRWHDGTSLTATDVAFTYRFLTDTTLGGEERPVPAPRFRGRTSLVESVERVDDRTLRFGFAQTAPEVAVRAFTVPVLPEAEWKPKATKAEFVGLDLFDGVTEALVWDNPEPVGSGVVQFERSVAEELLVCRRFNGHFLNRAEPEASHEFGGGLAFEELSVRVTPSDAAAVALLAAGEADATASNVDPSVVPRIGRSDDLQLLVTPSRSFYHVGFNTRRGVLSNQRFRRAVTRLLDKGALAGEVFDGYLTPAAVPVSPRRWVPSDLRWNGGDPEVPFVGTGGTLDTAAAKELFRTAGYQYSDDGTLLART